MLTLQNVWKEYRLDGETIFTALKNINLSVYEGEFTAIMGPSGSGKSTLMHIIGLLDKPSRGSVFVDKKDVLKLNDNQVSTLRNETVGFVFQQFNLINKLTVLENILLPTIYSRKKLPYDPKDKANYLLKRFGIEKQRNSYPNKMSGGQQQRTCIARALIMNPKFVLADEPTGNLDTKNGDEIMRLLMELNKEDKITILIVTHGKEIASLTKREIYIKDGEIV